MPKQGVGAVAVPIERRAPKWPVQLCFAFITLSALAGWAAIILVVWAFLDRI